MIGQTQFFRDTWAEIDLDALYQNVKKIRDGLPRETKLFVAVKANAYGHGDIQIAREALKAGAHGFVVALLDEALVLRQNGIDAPILVLGRIRATDAAVAARHHVSVPAFQMEWLKEAGQTMKAGDPPLKVHIKCDTGMGRIGLKDEKELKEIERFVKQTDALELEGIFTHFATADERSEAYYQKQLAAFKRFVSVLERPPKYVHAANSAAALCHSDSLFNAARIGIAVYGLSVSQELPSFVKGKPIFSLHTKIVHVKKIRPGECIGYGAGYQATDEEWIATLPIGYADGWLRKLEGQTVIVEGERAPIVGRICMDQTMVRLPRYFPTGTKVTLIGSQKGQSISVEEIADKLETINYEVTCTVNLRVPRVYMRKNEIVEIENRLFNRSL